MNGNMKYIDVQMLDRNISSDWWKEIIRCFVKENSQLQIRCWNEEIDEIKQAVKYGISHRERHETCIDGIVNAEFIAELLNSPEPKDKSNYNKMTNYFTISILAGKSKIESSHYGTQLYLVLSNEETNQFKKIMEPYINSFCILIIEI